MARQQCIEVSREFPVPVGRLFAYLAEHENLAKLFAPAKAERLCDGDSQRNGVGSARRLRVWPASPFVETVTAYRENELIEYRITEGSPLRNHVGTLRFTGLGPARARLDFVIRFEGKIPMIGPVVRNVLKHGIENGLTKLAL
jgi:uncharacterized protein YndB with AHSA1/START domain